MEFMRRFFQHVLPTGFMKVRYYGFLSPTCRVPLEHIRTLIELSYGFETTSSETEETPQLPSLFKVRRRALGVVRFTAP